MILEDSKQSSENKTFSHQLTRTIKFKCDNCQIEFVKIGKNIDYKSLNNKFHYCNIQCTYEHRRNMDGSYKEAPNKIEVECFNCKSKIKKWKSQIEGFEHHFCNKQCRGEAISSGILKMNIKMSEEIKEKLSSSAKERLSNKENHPMFNKHHSDETKQKISAKNVENGYAKGENNPMFGKTHSPEIRQKISEIVSAQILNGKRKVYGKNNHEKGDYFSIKTNKFFHYRSSWELACMKWLDANESVLKYDYECVRIEYYWEDKNRKYKRHYIPDFLINFTDGHKELWELKPAKLSVNEKTRLKTIAAENYCKENNIQNYRLLNKENLIKMEILI